MTESDTENTDSKPSKSDSRIIQVRMASEAAKKKSNSEKSDNSNNDE